MNRILKAIALASTGHQTQKRKVDGTPYIAHPLAVGMILQTITTDENIIIAGILHDVLEDTQISPEVIRAHFSPEVLGYVQAVTEDKSITDWRERKARSIHHLQTVSYPGKLIAAADKYHNLYTLCDDQAREGEAIWEKFKRGKAEQSWYYQTLYSLFKADHALQSLHIISEMDTYLQMLFPKEGAIPSPAKSG